MLLRDRFTLESREVRLAAGCHVLATGCRSRSPTAASPPLPSALRRVFRCVWLGNAWPDARLVFEAQLLASGFESAGVIAPRVATLFHRLRDDPELSAHSHPSQVPAPYPLFPYNGRAVHYSNSCSHLQYTDV